LDFSNANATNRTAMLFSESGNMMCRSGGLGGGEATMAFSDSTNPHLWSAVFKTNDRQLRQDGGTAASNSSSKTTYAYTYFKVGTLFGDFYAMLGDFAELIVFSGTDATTREKCEGYLAHRWGLTANLPGGHPYKTTPP